MRLVEFLILLLEAHAETLKSLAGLFGEHELLEILESVEEDQELSAELREVHSEWFRPPAADAPRSPYTELEGAILDFRLPSVLEFHLWAYPYYRSLIESSLDLNSRLDGKCDLAGLSIVDQATSYAKEWVKNLPLSPEQSLSAQKTAQFAWIRFRSHVLKRIGRRPVGPVY